MDSNSASVVEFNAKGIEFVENATLLAIFLIINSNSLHVAAQPRELSALSGVGIPSAKEPPVYSSPVIQDCFISSSS